jgi:glycosyltransferase involved in cell wall biosynthesis
VGHIDDLAELLPCADLVLLPSWHESFGLIALEAMSCGVVVIATDRGGTDEFIDDGTNGFLRDPEDVTGMADVAIRILHDDTLRKQMAEEARRDAVERFGARCVLKQYVALYDRVVGQGG